MKDYKTIYKNRIPEILSDPAIRNGVKRRLENTPKVNIAISRWQRGILLPSIDNLITISLVSGYSISYLVGETDIESPCYGNAKVYKKSTLNSSLQKKEPVLDKNRLNDLLKKEHITINKLAVMAENSFDTIKKAITNYPNARPNTLLSISKGLGVSIDYLLGLTNWKTWEEYDQLSANPFGILNPGEMAKVKPLAGENELLYCYKTKKNTIITIDPATDKVEELLSSNPKLARATVKKV